MGNLFEELKRRNVFRVGVAYLVVGWLMIEVVDTIAPRMAMPEWVPGLVIILVLIGFPISLLLAWAFEMTPEGVKKTEDVDADESITPSTGKKLNKLIAAVLFLALAFIAWDKLGPAPGPESAQDTVAEVTEASIAVLPFVNMSSDPEQEYFSDGITEEVLNVLAKIRDLKVAGRTSSFAFKGKNQDLRLIGESLNVGYILEGSVRRSGTRLRITAQLIRTDDGFHLWSEVYDREMQDIFDIQDDISRAIAEALTISLGIESGSLVRNRTDDVAAYEAYLRARGLYQARGEGMLGGILELAEVIVRDPSFAPGWAVLAQIYSVLPYHLSDLTKAQVDRYLSLAEIAAGRALDLDPQSSVATVALANSYRDRRRYIEAIETYERAVELDPNNADAQQQFAEIYLWLGHNKRGLELARKANELEPGVPILMNVLGWALVQSRHFDEAEEILLDAQKLDPGLGSLYSNLWAVYLAQRNESKLLHLLGQLGQQPDLIALQHALSRNVSVAKQSVFRGRGFWDRAIPLIDYKLEPGLTESASPLDIIEYVALGRANPDPSSMTLMFETFRNEPRFKEIVKATGQFAAWQEVGFPDDCRPVGDDDFVCD